MNKLLSSRFLSQKELLSLNFRKLGKDVLIDENVFIPNTNNIEIGNNVRIDMGSIISVPKNGEIIIKNNVHIAPYNLIYCGNNFKILFDNHSGLAAGCKLFGRTENYDGSFLMNPTHNSEDVMLIEGNIILEKFATLGCDCVLFPGSTIPIGSVLGSKSLYTGKKKLDEWSIYAGNPLKFFKTRDKHSEILSNKYIHENN
jgi:acetyltransferase-like isoleucine patch superfamily enzyme